jgi:hypothetical protein
MVEMLTRAFENLIARDSGPLHFRLILQPLMATLLAIRAGWADARRGQPIFFWTLYREPARTRAMLRNLWTIAGKVFIVAVALDVIYQIIVFQWVYPLETLIVATMLALVPCMLVRAIGNRIVTFVRLRRLREDKSISPDASTSLSDDVAAADSPKSAVGHGRLTK